MSEVIDTFRTSKYLGLAMSTLEKLRVTGGGPRYFKLGRSVRYKTTDLDAWMAERMVHSTSEIVGR